MIHHVTRETPPSRLDACIAFYSILGFAPVAVPEGIEGRAVWLESEVGQQIHLMPKPDARPASGHVAIVCPDYDSTLQALRDAGHEVQARREHWGSPRCYVHDPAGNLVELMLSPPDRGRDATPS